MPTSTKPRWRGRLHQGAFVLSVPAGVALVVHSRSAAAFVGAVIFAVSLSAAYATSAAYHLRSWSPRAERVMKHLDHAMIFVLIAGTYTPISLLVLDSSWGITLLSLAWAGCLVGIVLTVTCLDRLHRVGMVLYLCLGWLAVIAAPQLVANLDGFELALLVGGGLLYTVGAALLAAGRPALAPATFGYHEFWHVMVVTAGACHYVLVLLLVQA